ncbi:MAG: hypothetical protein NVSMB31_17850 [Vulcanimicrobiaceae bacterium]
MLKRAALFFAFLLSSTANGAIAQDTSQGFTAHGTIVAQVMFSGTRLNLGGDIAMMSRGQLLRFDLLRLSVPGVEPTLNALLSQFLPQGGISAVLDQTTGNTTVWSEARRKYYVFAGNKSGAAAAPAVSAESAVPGATGSIVHMLEMGRAVQGYKTFSESVAITGRSTVNGHPATNLHITYKAQKTTGALTDAVGDLSLAEDAQYLPVRIVATIKPANYSGRIEFTSIAAVAPADSVFAIPSGYAKANDPSEVFGAGLPHP